EELETQQNELRQSNENLESQSEELRLANENLEAQKTEIERKNVEVELKAKELAISSKYKSEFLANMSHELRTPLNSLLLLSSNLKKNKEGNLNEDQVKSASIIHSGGNELLNLINEILDLSKIEAGMMNVEFKKIKLQDVADKLERDFKHMCKDKGLELKVQLSPNLPSTVFTDQNRMEQILKNLMSNAIKFTNKGSITVDFTQPAQGVNLFRSGLEPENTFAIAISDTGIGIPENKREVIFEAFQQADGGTSRKYGGTGLGLSISRELTTILGGEIQLKGQLEKGSTFTLYLPLNSGEASISTIKPEGGDPSTTPSQTHILKKSKPPITPKAEFKIKDDRDNLKKGDNSILLLIEDDPNFANILVDQCHKQNFKCLAANSGEEGVILAETYLPDGIILDLNLPGMDGWSVLNTI
ncbi:MAG: response regulator, partial [Spirochaetaceae bacterium]|nr:response regulator [Spirochaetaceae bacterium]